MKVQRLLVILLCGVDFLLLSSDRKMYGRVNPELSLNSHTISCKRSHAQQKIKGTRFFEIVTVKTFSLDLPASEIKHSKTEEVPLKGRVENILLRIILACCSRQNKLYCKSDYKKVT